MSSQLKQAKHFAGRTVIRAVTKRYPRAYDYWNHHRQGLEQGTVELALSMLKSEKSIAGDQGHVLIFTQRYWKIHAAIELLLARQLQESGFSVTVVGCGQGVLTCDNDVIEGKTVTTHNCAHCAFLLRMMARRFGVNYLSVKEYVEEHDLHVHVEDDNKRVFYESVVDVSWRRLCRSRDIAGEREFALRRKLVESAAVYDGFFAHYLRNNVFVRVVMLNGLFFAEDLLRRYCHQEGIPYVSYELGQLPNSIVVARDETAVPYRVTTQHKEQLERDLSVGQREWIESYMAGRQESVYLGNGRDITELVPLKQLRDKKVYAMFTNVIWDSAVVGRETIFDSMFEWLKTTIAEFEEKEHSLLLIRAHPAEVTLRAPQFRSRQPVANYLRNFKLPSNIYVIPSTEDINSYSILAHADVGLVYTTTLGLEMACRGIPVIVAGRSHYYDQAFVYTPRSVKQYVTMLNKHLMVDEGMQEAARRYAYVLYHDYHRVLKGIKRVGTTFEYTEEQSNLAEMFGFALNDADPR